MTEDELIALVGHRFEGGTYTIAQWENRLLTEATGRAALPDGLAHPIALFHASMAGARVTIGDILTLAGMEAPDGDDGVVLLGYDWEFLQPLREDEPYTMEGGVIAAERKTGRSGRTTDLLTFEITLTDREGEATGRTTNVWGFRRGET